MDEGKAEGLYQFDEEFRDSIATVDEKGKRIWIYPKKPEGRYHRLRVGITVVLLSLLFAGPFITIGGRPFLLLNIFERRFVVFGQVFWPQDFILLAIALITLFVFVILFTVVFGRLWCGWACPQTLFMEMVFRKIEYWIEGNAHDQRKLDQGPWTSEKIIKKVSKQVIFLIISILIAHVSLGYLIGVEDTLAIVQQSPLKHPAGFLGLVGFTLVFYGVFARFREQACIAVCPYGRLQGVLLGKDSIVVAYDWLRGEPRKKIKKHEVGVVRGDCIDCKLCVHVCPTGIDIRNGTQLECVNCTACMDACDDVMEKIGKPKGLVRFASFNSIKDKILHVIRPRVVGYSVVLLVLVGVLFYLVFTRTEVETTVLKAPGTLYQKTQDGYISNLYNIEFVNKTFEDIPLTVRVETPSEAVLARVGAQEVIVPAEKMLRGVYFIKIKESDVHEARVRIVLGIYHGDKLIERVKTRFIGPVKKIRN